MSESKEHFIRISKLFLNFKLRMFIAILCMIIAALCTGFHAWLVKPALDNVLINADRFYLYFIPIAILITGIIKGLVTYIQITSLQFMSHRIIEKLRRDVFKNIINVHYGFFVKNKIGSLITRITTDTYYLSGGNGQHIYCINKRFFNFDCFNRKYVLSKLEISMHFYSNFSIGYCSNKSFR